MQHGARSIKQKYKAEANLIFSLRAAAAVRHFYANAFLRMVLSLNIYV